MNFPLILADPITLTAIGAAAGGLAGIGGLATQLFGGKPAAPTAGQTSNKTLLGQ
jgi:hypothetical protein